MGLSQEAIDEMTIVSTIVRVPLLHSLTMGAMAHAPLRTKLEITAYSTLRSLRDGGMMMAINIQYRATLSAETMAEGKMPPAMMPAAQPDAHESVDVRAAE